MSVALIILAVTVAVSLAGIYGSPAIIQRSLFRPYWFLRRRQYETIVTSGFVHADLSHLLFNAFTFFFFAFQVERQVGSARFAALYLFGLVASDVGTYFKHRNDPDYASLGASGAISGVLAAYVLYFPRNRVLVWFWFRILAVPALVVIGLWAVLQLVSGAGTLIAAGSGGGVAYLAHVGGFVGGLALAWVLMPREVRVARRGADPYN